MWKDEEKEVAGRFGSRCCVASAAKLYLVAINFRANQRRLTPQINAA